MARSHLRHTVRDRAGNVVQNAKCFVYLAGTVNAVSDLYTAASGGSTVTFLTSNAQGEIEGWMTTPKTVDIKVTDNTDAAYYPTAPSSLLSWSDFTDTVEVHPRPEDLEVGSDIWVNVKDQLYGATGLGLADDSVAIQAAIDAADAAGGGTVYFPPGNYLLTTGLLLSRATDGEIAVKLLGSGTGSKITVASAISAIKVRNTGGSLQTIRSAVSNLRFALNHASAIGIELTHGCDGFYDNLEFAGVGIGIKLSGNDTTTIGNQFSNLRFLFPGKAIWLNGGSYNIFTNVLVIEGISGTNAIQVDSGASSNVIDGFMVRGNLLAGGVGGGNGAIEISGEGTVLSNGRIFDSYANGLHLAGGVNGVIVEGVKIVDSQKHGLYANCVNSSFDVQLLRSSVAGAGSYSHIHIVGTATGNVFNAAFVGTDALYDINEASGTITDNTYVVGDLPNGVNMGTANLRLGDGIVVTAASATAQAGLRLPHGTAPTSPVNGDVWTTTAGLFVRVNGATVGPLS